MSRTVDRMKFNALVDALSAGQTVESAANAAGVKLATLRTWLGRAALGEYPYAEIHDACDPTSSSRS